MPTKALVVRDEWVEAVKQAWRRAQFCPHYTPSYKNCDTCLARWATEALLPLIERDVLCADGPTAYWRGLLDGMERERDEARAEVERLVRLVETLRGTLTEFEASRFDRDRALAAARKLRVVHKASCPDGDSRCPTCAETAWVEGENG